MSRRETTRQAHGGRASKFAVLAVALLCAVALSAVLEDSESDAADSGTQTAEKFKVKVTVTNGTGSEKEVEKTKDAELTILPNTGYLLPESGAIKKTDLKGTFKDFTYTPNTARTSGTIKVTEVGSEVTLTVACVKICKVKVTVTNGTGAETTVDENKTATLTVKPGPGYVLPESGSVKKTDFTGTFKDFAYTPNTARTSATVVVSEVKGDVTLTIACVKMIPIEMVSTVEGKSTTEAVGSPVVPGTEVSGKFKQVSGYDLPRSISVMQGTTAVASSNYTYDSYTGEFTLKPAAVQGESKITVTGVYSNSQFRFTSSVVDGDIKDKAAIKPTYNKPLTITLVANDHHDLPDPKDLIVTNGGSTSFTYDATTGVVKISKVVGDVSVRAKCSAETYTVTYYDADGKTKLDLEPQRFSYGVGCVLPADVAKTDYIFVCWYDVNGNAISQIGADWVPAEGAAGNVDVFAYFVDDLTKYDVMDYQLPYIILAILSLIGVIAVPFVLKVRR